MPGGLRCLWLLMGHLLSWEVVGETGRCCPMAWMPFLSSPHLPVQSTPWYIPDCLSVLTHPPTLPPAYLLPPPRPSPPPPDEALAIPPCLSALTPTYPPSHFSPPPTSLLLPLRRGSCQPPEAARVQADAGAGGHVQDVCGPEALEVSKGGGGEHPNSEFCSSADLIPS